MRDSWTAERILLLKKLWAEGATANVIAERLGGTSRSAVMGKIFRLRLGASMARPPAEQNIDASGKSKRAGSRAADVQPTLMLNFPPGRRRRRRKRRKPAEGAAANRRQHKSLLELTNESCRWPHGRPGTDRFFFCGRPEADLELGIPYCARHMRRAYGAEDIGNQQKTETTV